MRSHMVNENFLRRRRRRRWWIVFKCEIQRKNWYCVKMKCSLKINLSQFILIARSHTRPPFVAHSGPMNAHVNRFREGKKKNERKIIIILKWNGIFIQKSQWKEFYLNSNQRLFWTRIREGQTKRETAKNREEWKAKKKSFKCHHRVGNSLKYHKKVIYHRTRLCHKLLSCHCIWLKSDRFVMKWNDGVQIKMMAKHRLYALLLAIFRIKWTMDSNRTNPPLTAVTNKIFKRNTLKTKFLLAKMLIRSLLYIVITSRLSWVEITLARFRNGWKKRAVFSIERWKS